MANIIQPTDAELKILTLLWRNGAMSVRQINEKLNNEKEVGYTTTLKIMQIMLEKGLLTRDTELKSHIYSANIQETNVKNKMIKNLVNQVFGGSRSNLVMQVLGNSNASLEEINEIKEYIKFLESKNKTEE
ncbi:MAG TPA: BlaI/MecI/CopY family transcriptional regulator [Saprospiraceae bacterium]|nr:BlaI/MecI/CopY family transcriptional regulator [Saprospiraceae bacterium]